MHQIDTITAAAVMPKPAAPGKAGFFTSGDFREGVPATIPGADWFNSVQSELINAVQGAGITPDKSDNAQLLKALRTLIQRSRWAPGQIIVMAGKKPPEGSLLCDGAAVSRITYADLFAVVGTIYGEGDGKTTFNVPSMKEGTVFTHTSNPDHVGTYARGQNLAHTHTATTAAVGDHAHYIGVYAAGAHNHGASSDAAGNHVHGAWTDQQGWHAHTGGTSGNGEHAHALVGSNIVIDLGGYDGSIGYAGQNSPRLHSQPAGNVTTNATGAHSHSFTTDGNGTHTHTIGMNGQGSHAHTISIAPTGDHAHTLDNRGAGAHDHTVTVANSGGEDNLAAGLRAMYCIAY